MIKNLVFLTVILALAFFGYNIFYNVVHYKVDALNSSLEKIPVILVSNDDNVIKEINARFDSLSFVKNINISMADTLRKNLIKKYHLSQVENYLKDSNLPNILKIFIKKGMFTGENKALIAGILKNYDNDIIVKYNDELWQETIDKTDFYKSIFLNLSLIYWGIVLILYLYLKFVFDRMNDGFWIKYAKSGGRYRKRFIYGIYEAIIVSTISVIAAYLLFYPLKVFSPYFAIINVKVLAIEFCGVLCVNLLTILFIKRKYD